MDTIRYQREGEAFENWALSEGITNILDPRFAVARKAWKAALQWKEGRTQLDTGVHYERGERVRVTLGFHKGVEGVVEFVEPSGRVWILRDTATTPTFFYPAELERVIPPPPESKP